MYNYRAKVVRWLDGDTVDVMIDLGFHTYKRERLRLARIDTPEIRGKERPQGLISKAEVEKLCPVDSDIIVQSTKRGKYGRFIAEIYKDDLNINQHLIDSGLALEVKYG